MPDEGLTTLIVQVVVGGGCVVLTVTVRVADAPWLAAVSVYEPAVANVTVVDARPLLPVVPEAKNVIPVLRLALNSTVCPDEGLPSR